MANKVEVKIKSGALRDIMKSPEAQSMVHSLAEGVQSRASGSNPKALYVVADSARRAVSARSVVITGNYVAMRDTRDNNTLLKAL